MQAICDAMARLLDGTRIRSDGKLTVKSLADEAGVKRWIIRHPHTDLQAVPGPVPTTRDAIRSPCSGLEEELEHLREENKRLREDLREAKVTTSLLERHIAVDALEHMRRPPNIDTRDSVRPVPDETDSRT